MGVVAENEKSLVFTGDRHGRCFSVGFWSVVREPLPFSWLSNTVRSNDGYHPWVVGFDLHLGGVQ
jgi:hypothetical protein